MSLSFVSSAVLSSSDGISHNEERQIESKEVQALRGKQTAAKPLFDQLRKNQEEEEAEREEFQRSIMRGTLALDEEDCAHLDSLQKQRQEREAMVKADTEQELALFRAARADRMESQVVLLSQQDEETKEPAVPDKSQQVKSKPKTIAPVIKVKRRLRPPSDKDADESKVESKTKKQKQETKETSNTTGTSKSDNADETKEENGLGGLLGGYGSSDDESD